MAATVSSAWSKPGAWALDAEEHEEELIQESAAAAAAAAKAIPTKDTSEFPSLAAAASTKTKKKKAQTLSLGEFYTADQGKKFQAGGAAHANKGLTVDEQLMLPTGPRQRTAEEMDRTKLGGGFRSYGSDSSKWGGADRGEEKRGGFERREREPLPPSRADEIDDWGAAKKSSIGGGSGFDRRGDRGERGERGGFFSDSQSRADESNSWVSNKSFNAPSERRGYGGGFDRERRGGFESSNGNGADSDSWGRKSGGGAFDSLSSLRERRGGGEMNGGGAAADSETWGKRREDGIGAGSGSGAGRPKLNLQPRRLPVGESEEGVGVKVTSKGSNPFGDARPREQVLKEKGQDWKEIDEKLEAMKKKEVGPVDGPAFGKRGFGSGNGRVAEERSWRKNETVDSRPPSAENSENGVTEVTEEPENREPENREPEN